MTNPEENMRADLPTYTDAEQGTDQDLDARTDVGIRSVAYQRQQAETRKRLADQLREDAGTQSVESSALAAVDRRPARPPRGKPPVAADTTDAILYARVSTRDQARTGGGEEGYSIPHQREACRAKAHALGAVVVEEYIDAGESAKTAQRPELQRLLKDIKKRRIRYLIVHKIDRLARNREDDMAIRMALARSGVELVSCTENITNSAHGRFLHNIMADTAEFYRENLAEEVMKGLIRKAKEGGTPFRAPLGYLNTREFVDGVGVARIILDPERAPIVRWCLEQYATGQWTATELVIAARARGLTTRATRTKAAEPINITTMFNVLHNPYYMGVIAYNGYHYEGKHQPLVTPDVWLRIQDILAAHRHAGEKDRKHPHYLRGTIFCGECGGRLVYSRHRGNGGLYEYFHCVKKKLRENNCRRGGIRLAAVEDGVVRFYQTFQPSRSYLAALEGEIMAEFRAQRADAEQNAQRARRRRTAVLDERSKLLRAHYDDIVPADLLKTEMERLTRDLAAADAAIKAADASAEDIEKTLQAALAVAGDCHRQYQAAPPAIRRQINQGFFTKLWLGADGRVERYELTEPFRQLLDAQLVRMLAGRDASLGGVDTAQNDTIPEDDLFRDGVNKTYLVGDTGFEPVTSSVSRKRAPTAPIARYVVRGGDGI